MSHLRSFDTERDLGESQRLIDKYFPHFSKKSLTFRLSVIFTKGFSSYILCPIYPIR